MGSHSGAEVCAELSTPPGTLGQLGMPVTLIGSDLKTWGWNKGPWPQRREPLPRSWREVSRNLDQPAGEPHSLTRRTLPFLVLGWIPVAWQACLCPTPCAPQGAHANFWLRNVFRTAQLPCWWGAGTGGRGGRKPHSSPALFLTIHPRKHFLEAQLWADPVWGFTTHNVPRIPPTPPTKTEITDCNGKT